jgi:hypothetical protein
MTVLAEIVLVLVAAASVAVCLALLPGAADRGRRRLQVRAPSRPEQLTRLERLVVTSEASALQAHAYLRPLLAEIASRRLATRGQTLDDMSDLTGRQVLGDQLWEIVRPGRPFPHDRRGRGLSTRDLAAMFDVLERL